MLTTIEKAAENFCIHQIRESYTIKDGTTQKEKLFIAYIDINTQDDKNYRVYIAADRAFMQKVSKLFLEEDESDEETLQDMTLETANLIIGNAKVIAQETDENNYTIGTPQLEVSDTFNFEIDDSKTIKIDNDELTIAIKELNG
jgi:hypothetical protein